VGCRNGGWHGGWVGGQQGWEEERGKNHRIPSKLLRNITGTTRVQHARSTLAAGWARAERAGAGRRGSGELAELRSLVARRAGAEGLAGWRGLGRKEEAKAKVPARGFDRAPDGIPDSNFPDEPDIASRCPAFQWHPTVTLPLPHGHPKGWPRGFLVWWSGLHGDTCLIP
jgi:hypothetical protein